MSSARPNSNSQPSAKPDFRPRDFPLQQWDRSVEARARHLVQLALEEDFADQRDWTTWATIAADDQDAAVFVNRVPGVVCGLPLVPIVLEELTRRDPNVGHVQWTALVADGQSVPPQAQLGRLTGSTRTILQMERIALNFLGRLSGIATLTADFVKQLAASSARIYDTRKTTPGWRSLEKYAVACGGGRNHRLGLYAAIMLKDNHLAGADAGISGERLPETVRQAQHHLQSAIEEKLLAEWPIFEVEVDSLSQLETLLRAEFAAPIDIILLDNMSNQELRQAVALRDRLRPGLQLEASGGVHLGTVAEIGQTGVERISSGALTHSATQWDVGLDWTGANADADASASASDSRLAN